MNEREVHNFWNSHPCGENLVGGIKGDYEDFFSKYDAYRYKKEGHILKCLDSIDLQNKRVLEIGLGLGADSEQLIRRGAIWSGVDLTPESINRVTTRLKLRGLPYERLETGSVCNLPFENDSFDIIFSHGVLHHVPEISKAQAEIARVLKPRGRLVAMLYAKYSLNYLASISIVRRLALLLLYASGVNYKGDSLVAQHLENAKQFGLFKYLAMKNFIHRNTDGPLNPYSKVYSLADVESDFCDFRIIKAHKEFMHAPPLPVSWLPFKHLIGWHLWVHMDPKKHKELVDESKQQ